MPHKKLFLVLVYALLGMSLVLMVAAATKPDSYIITKQLAPGITYTQEINKKNPLVINVVTVDLKAEGVSVSVVPAQDHVGGSDITKGREVVTKVAQRHKAVVGINGDYFPYTGDPLGVGIHDGEIFSEPWIGNTKGGPRVALGILDGMKQAMIDKPGYAGVVYITHAVSTNPPPSNDKADTLNNPSAVSVQPQQRTGQDVGVNASYTVHGLNRAVGKDEIVVFTPIFKGERVSKPGGIYLVVSGINLPLRTNKLMTGKVESIHETLDGLGTVPDGCVVISGGPGKGGEFLRNNAHEGDSLSFILGVGSVANPAGALQIASLPRDANDLPSRSANSMDRTAVLWAYVREAVGGGPRLLSNGQISIDSGDEGFDNGFVNFKYPRTAVGITQDGSHLILVAVDGHQAASEGISLYDLAAVLKRYGAYDAINLDGGGSTTMAVNGVSVNDGMERPVADMLLVTSDRSRDDIYDSAQPDVTDRKDTEIVLPSRSLFAGESETLSVTCKGRPVSLNSPDLVWQGAVFELRKNMLTGKDKEQGNLDTRLPKVNPVKTDNTGVLIEESPIPNSVNVEVHNEPIRASSPKYDTIISVPPIGFVDQSGVFTALRTGTGVIKTIYKGRPVNALISVEDRPVIVTGAKINAILEKDASGASNRGRLLLHVNRPKGEPIAYTIVYIRVENGIADTENIRTDEDGSASIGITWNQTTGRKVNISLPGSKAITVEQKN